MKIKIFMGTSTRFIIVVCIILVALLCTNCFASIVETGQKNQLESSLSQLSKHEKEWYQKFHNGILFFSGWKQITQDLVSKFSHRDELNLENNLRILGEKIGLEWCKENDVRKINTEMLRKWGDMLSKAVDHGINQVTKTINYVETEVDTILNNSYSSNKQVTN